MISNIKADLISINELSSQDPKALVRDGTKFYDDQIKEIAATILAGDKKVILISGASSSGKTTTSHILQNKLATLGISSFVISMDDFFVDMHTLPLREDGKHDIENLIALDTKAIVKCLGELLSKGETSIPQFDFVTHTRKKDWVHCKLHRNEVVLMEGLHALNPEIISGLDLDKIYRIYIYCGGEYTVHGRKYLDSRQIRLMRRMVRDERDRNAPLLETISMWGEVCKGEDNNVTPYIDLADYQLNTFHPFEVLLYKQDLQQGLAEIKDDKTAKTLLGKLKYVGYLPSKLVPSDSLLREFIGEKDTKNI